MSEYLDEKYGFSEVVALNILTADQVVMLAHYYKLMDEIENSLGINPNLDLLTAAQIKLESSHPKSHAVYLKYQELVGQVFDSASDGSVQDSREVEFDHYYNYQPYP